MAETPYFKGFAAFYIKNALPGLFLNFRKSPCLKGYSLFSKKKVLKNNGMS